jgi:hypothetical protein
VAIEFDLESDTGLDQAIENFNASLATEFPDHGVQADREYLYWSESTPECPDPRSWGLDRIDQLELPRDRCFNPVGDGEGITVYVLDTGIDKRNKQFKDVNVRAFRDDKIDFDDKNGHGTLVAGLIAGQQTGVARKATLISYKLLDDDGVTSAAALHNALCEIDEKTNYANGPQTVINLSLSGPSFPRAKTVLGRLLSKGVTIVGAAGNSNGADACEGFPGEYASDNGVIVVGSSSRRDRIAWHSAAGKCVSIFAPGVATRSAAPRKRGTRFASGTSAATAYVSGAVAAVKSANRIPQESRGADTLQALVRDRSFVIEDDALKSNELGPNTSPMRPLLFCGSNDNATNPDPTRQLRPTIGTPKPSITTAQPAPGDSGVDFFAAIGVGHTGDARTGYGLVDTVLDRESRLGVGYAFPLSSPWLLTSRLDVASLGVGSERLLESNRAELASTLTYDLGEHSIGGALSSTRYWADRDAAFTSHRATFGYAWTPDAGGGCTPWIAGLYLSKEFADDEQGNERQVFDQGGEGWSAALRFMHERRQRGRACTLTSIMARPAPTTGSYVDVSLGRSRFHADQRAWSGESWYLNARGSVRLGQRSWYFEPAIGYQHTDYDHALAPSELAPFEASVLGPAPLGNAPSPEIGEWSKPNRDLDGRVLSTTIRRTLPLMRKNAIDLAGSIALERSDSSQSFLKQARTIYLFTVTFRPAKMRLRKWGGQTGSGSTVVIGGGGPSGGPRPDPVTNCSSPPCS